MIMVQRYSNNGFCVADADGGYVKYEDYAKLESHLNGILNMLVELDNDLAYGVIPDEYAYDMVG
ncbi:hypothetical protein ACVPRA_18245, partial [Salmonella enterica subsp. enterica serovar Enteritidis]